MSAKGWKKFEKSKFWSWATLGGNKVATAFRTMFSGRDFKRELDRLAYEQNIRDKGYTLEEWFSAFPEERDKYESITGTTLGDAVRSAFNDPNRDPFLDTIQGVVDSATGQRDVKENEKNRQFQSDQAEITRQWEAEQAQIAREWDSIGAQMERAAAAGVNPISIAMQNGGINASATSPMPSAPGVPSGSSGLMHNGALDIAATVFNGVGTFAEQRLKQSQSDDIVIMRQYNIAEKIAYTDHLRELCKGAGLSNVAQEINNRWLDAFNNATYHNMMADLGYKYQNTAESRSRTQLNLQQQAQIKQDMELSLQRFNATLPLELQLSEAQIKLTNNQAGEVYEEIALRHLQAIEQEERNKQASAEAEASQIQTNISRQTMEDAINAFHNDMAKGAAEAGIALNDYIYYSVTPKSISEAVGRVPVMLNKIGEKRFNKKHGLYTDKQMILNNVHGLE